MKKLFPAFAFVAVACGGGGGGGIERQAPAPLAPLRESLQGSQSATVLVLGDSTGDERWEWVHGFARKLVDRYPGYEVRLVDWDRANDTYRDPVTYGQVGSSLVLTIYNGSIASATIDTWLAPSREGRLLPSQPVQLVLVSASHNHGAQVGEEWTKRLDRVESQLARRYPGSQHTYLTQNPRSEPASYREQHATRRTELLAWAKRRTLATVDVFAAYPSLVGEYLDGAGIHPRAAGQQIWIDAMAAAFDLTSSPK